MNTRSGKKRSAFDKAMARGEGLKNDEDSSHYNQSNASVQD